MVFANLTYEDKQAFFSLLDEYFESRPHLVGGGNSAAGGIVIKPEQAMAAASTAASFYNKNAPAGSRTLPPLATGSNSTPPYSPSTPDSHSHSPAPRENAGQKTFNSASRFVSSGMNKVTSNSHVSSALGKVGAGNLANKFNKPSPPPVSSASADRERTLPPPAPGSRGGGAAGLTSSKSFGHVDTSSTGSAVKTMFRDPKKVSTPTAEHHLPPALGAPRNNLPPPVRRDRAGSGAGSAASSTPQLPQAIALYDYAGADETDLAVHENQTVTVVNKTSDDWWTCEDDQGKQGLVPANYLKEL